MEMRVGACTAGLSLIGIGLLITGPGFANPQDDQWHRAQLVTASNVLPPNSLLDEVQLVGLHRVPLQTAASKLSVRVGTTLSSEQITADVRALNQTGWFEDISVKVRQQDPSTPADHKNHIALEFHVLEYPVLSGVQFNGSKVLSQQQIKKLLVQQKLGLEQGSLANPANLHRVRSAIQAVLASEGHPQARVSIAEQRLPGEQARVRFRMDDGPRLPLTTVRFSGNPTLPESVLRRQMHEINPDAWFSGLRDKNVFTATKAEEDRLSLENYLENHGFPYARVGIPQVAQVNARSSRYLPWRHRRFESGMSMALPVEAGAFYQFGPIELSAPLREKLGPEKKSNRALSGLTSGQPYSPNAMRSVQRSLELRVRKNFKRKKQDGNYRLQAVSEFDNATHLASVKFDFDPAPSYSVRRIEFTGNQRFPDRFLRRRIGLREGQILDEYELEGGLARIAQTGYFQPFKKEDVRIETRDVTHTADVTVHVHEKGRQRTAFSGGREQFGSTLGIAYTVFNLLGMDEFLSTQLDGGPQSLQLAIGLAMEGFLGSRGTLALSVFDTFVRPHLTTGIRAPFERSHNEGMQTGWSFAASDVDAIGIHFGTSHSLTDWGVKQPASGGTPLADLRSVTSSHILGIGWTHYSGMQTVEVADSVSGGLLGGTENLLKSQAEFGRMLPDQVFDSHNAWAFRTTVRAVASYKGDMPLSARLFSGEDLVRGLRSGGLGPYQILTNTSSGTTSSAIVPAGADLIAATNLEYRIPLRLGIEGAAFFDTGSGLLLPNWLGKSRPQLIDSTNGLIHGSMGFELRWTLPGVGVPLRVNYSIQVLRFNHALLMPDGSILHFHDRLGSLGWGLGKLF
jgi:outer membrane protein assembly complex protein YaeT